VITDNALFHDRSVAEYTANLCANAIGQYIFGALAHESKAQITSWCKEMRAYYGGEIVKVYNELKAMEPKLIVSSPDASIYSVIDVRNIVAPGFDGRAFVQYCASEGAVEIDGVMTTLLAAPMNGFYDIAEGEANPGSTQFRISYVETPDKLAQVPEAFIKLLRQYEAKRSACE
jgi:aspartate aminotransferase